MQVRTNYILIDFENVQPGLPEQLTHDHFKLLVFVGASQTKLPFETATSLQRLGSRAEYIKISGNGSNALDFHIAYYIGQLAASDPTAIFHIISKDTGFDPLIQHLKSRKIRAGRSKAIADIPLIKTANSKTLTERLELIVAKLQHHPPARPRADKSLRHWIAHSFQNQLSEEEVSEIVQGLSKKGYLTIDKGKVTYSLPGEV